MHLKEPSITVREVKLGTRWTLRIIDTMGRSCRVNGHSAQVRSDG
jgi:hypothetical protein